MANRFDRFDDLPRGRISVELISNDEEMGKWIEFFSRDIWVDVSWFRIVACGVESDVL